jgi:hypothetical protein
MRASLQAKKLCSCIKKVRKTLKNRRTSEQSAIAICVKSIFHRRGKTVRRFVCKPTPKATIAMKK